MRRYIFAALAAFVSIGLGAQSLGDAYTFSANDYMGSARVIGLGGAAGALGSDVGSVSINPAGSAVAGYSQLVFSPIMNISNVSTSFALTPDSEKQSGSRASKSRFTLPSMALTSRFDSSLLPNTYVTVGVFVNTVYNYNYKHDASGANSYSSKFAEMARAAQGYTNSDLESSSFYDAHPDLWDVAMGYKVGLISPYGSGDSDYVGCTEVLTDDGRRYVPSALTQRSRNFTSGNKSDLILNMAWDFSHKFYLGANIGIPMLTYSNVERYSEVAQVVEDFPVRFTYSDGYVENTYFDNAVYQYNYSASGSGVYVKAGFIWLPTKNLRLGAAYQSPTVLDIDETWVHSGRVTYANGTSYSGSSRQGEYQYSIITPDCVDLSVAYTFGRLGLVSVDGSIEDYSKVKFRDSAYDSGQYDFLNATAAAFSGKAYSLRVGAELNVGKNLALRAGYNVKTSAEKYYTVDGSDFYYEDYDDDYYIGRKTLPDNAKYINDIRQSFSAGLGYNPAGSFFADFAVRFTKLPPSAYQPYYNYDDVMSSVFYSDKKSLVNMVLTFGWRF